MGQGLHRIVAFRVAKFFQRHIGRLGPFHPVVSMLLLHADVVHQVAARHVVAGAFAEADLLEVLGHEARELLDR